MNIEVDEHSSDVGVLTRVEAFVNSLNEIKTAPAAAVSDYVRQAGRKQANLKTGLSELRNGTTICLPHLFPYAHIFAGLLRQQGRKAITLPLTSEASVDLGRKHTLTSEYFSFTALLGDVLAHLKQNGAGPEKFTVFIPQSEGAEVDGQYNRLLRTILDEEGHGNVDILAPFLEDALFESPEQAEAVWLGLLAGDLVNLAPLEQRTVELGNILSLVARGELNLGALKSMARRIGRNLPVRSPGKSILALGEPAVLFNDYLNNHRLRNLREQGHRLVINPMSEMMWLFWNDYLQQNPDKSDRNFQQNLQALAEGILAVSRSLGKHSPFEKELDRLVRTADETVGYYAGAYGRYRQAKLLLSPAGIDGIITLTSTYENTGVALGILQRALTNGVPALNLTFDGNCDENDQARLESFIHYL